MPRSKTLEEAFWSKVDKRGPDECWPWIGRRNPKGYGTLTRCVNGRPYQHTATHIAWAFGNDAPFPPGLFACHRCDNPPCVNPAHIWPGTYEENMEDAVAKGRLSSFRKCTHHDVPNAFRTYLGNGRPQRRCKLCEKEANRLRYPVGAALRAVLRLAPADRAIFNRRLAEKDAAA